MPKLIWPPAVLQSARHCYRFLAQQSPVAVSCGLTAIRDGVRTIEAVRPAAKAEPALREWLIAYRQ